MSNITRGVLLLIACVFFRKYFSIWTVAASCIKPKQNRERDSISLGGISSIRGRIIEITAAADFERARWGVQRSRAQLYSAAEPGKYLH